MQERQLPRSQDLRTSIPTARKRHVALVQAVKVLLCTTPEVLRIAVDRAVRVDEAWLARLAEGGPLAALLGLHSKPRASLACRLQHVHVYLLGPAPGRLGPLREALAKDPAVGLQRIRIQALHGCDHVGYGDVDRRCRLRIAAILEDRNEPLRSLERLHQEGRIGGHGGMMSQAGRSNHKRVMMLKLRLRCRRGAHIEPSAPRRCELHRGELRWLVARHAGLAQTNLN
mmetsp:Transcript_156164/g.500972  ORF Transcript_156164/g.500972 Transcript_156164/m.500972 type:complete len:228 (-) Transcript_156164:34-717(-)